MERVLILKPGDRYLQGLGTVDKRMIILVNIEKRMTSREMDLVEEMAV